jgi:Cu+-exporting ATPase
MTSESDMVVGDSGRRTAQLLVSNMHCPSCVEAITQLLEPVVYVKDLSVNLLQRTVTFQIDSAQVPSGSTGHADPIDEVKRLLQSEGGFAIDTPSSTITGPSRKPRAHHGSWLERFPIGKEARAEKRRREAMEERRRRHLERCEVCRQELMGSHVSTGSPPGAAEQKAVPSPSPPPASPPRSQDAVRTTLSIEGMTCASCTRSITSALKSHPDVLDVEVSLLSSSGVVRHRSTLAPEAVAELVEDAGFEASVIRTERTAVQLDGSQQSNGLKRTTLAIEGMTCASCSSAIQAVLDNKAGVESVSVDVLGNSAVVVHRDELSPADIKEEIEDIGYGAEVVSTTDEVRGNRDDTGTKGKGKASDDTRTIDIAVQGIFCGDCVSKLNAFLSTLPLVSFTPFTLARQSTTVSYLPHQLLTIRDILAGLSGVAPEFTAEVVRTQTLSDRSQEIQRREVRKLAWHLGVAIIFAIPTFIMLVLARGSFALKLTIQVQLSGWYYFPATARSVRCG